MPQRKIVIEPDPILREKSATSDPEINADNTRHIIIDIILIKRNGSSKTPRLKKYRFKELVI